MTLSQAIPPVHLAQSANIDAVIVSHHAALAADHVFRLNVLAELPILNPYVKLDQFTGVSFRVTLPEVHILHNH